MLHVGGMHWLAVPSVPWLFIERALMVALTGMSLTCIAYARAGSCRQFSMVADDVMTDHVTLRDLAELVFYPPP